MRRTDWLSIFIIWVISGAITACTGVAPETTSTNITPPAEASTQAAPAAESLRQQTVIFDTADGAVQELHNWNPLAPGRRLDHGYHQAVIEPLFILNYETGEIEGWLAESMTANETLDEWTLTVREGVTWRDGEPFDADDIIFTIDLWQNYPTLAGAESLNSILESYEKLDSHTIRLTLQRPNPRFQLDVWTVKVWGGPVIVPEHIWRGKDPLTFTYYDPEQGWPLFTGPYMLESVAEREVVYQRNEGWWGAETGWKPLPAPQRLIWQVFDNEAAKIEAMINGGVDSLVNISLSSLLEIKQSNPNVVTQYEGLPYAWVPDPCSRILEINHTVPPWDEPAMRWALNYAIDRDEIVAFAFDDTTIPSRHFFPAYAPLNRYIDLLEAARLYEQFPLLEYNPEQARELIVAQGYTMDESGYFQRDGEPLTLHIASVTSEEFTRLAKILASQFEEIGIKVQITEQPYSTNWFGNFKTDEYQVKASWLCGSVNEPWASMDTFSTRWYQPPGQSTSEGQNVSRWSGPAAEEYSNLVAEIGLLPLGDPEIDPLFVEAMEIWLAELPVIPLTQARIIIPFEATYWQGWPTAENNYIHPPTWWQSTHSIIHHLEPTGQP